jgi:hypothetical protein
MCGHDWECRFQAVRGDVRCPACTASEHAGPSALLEVLLMGLPFIANLALLVYAVC